VLPNRTLVFLLCTLLIESKTYGAILRHLVLPYDSAFSLQTQGACLAAKDELDSHWCNPALFHSDTASPIKADMILSAHRDTYDTTEVLVDRPIDKPFVDSLFRNKGFRPFSGLLRIETVNRFFSLAYVPVHALGAYQLGNPSLPELSVVGVRGSNFLFTSAVELLSQSSFDLRLGFVASWFQRRVYEVETDVLEVAVVDEKELVSEHTVRGIDLDLGLTMTSKHEYLPDFGFVIRDLFSPQSPGVEAERNIDMEPNFRSRIFYGLGYSLKSSFGSLRASAVGSAYGFGRRWDRYSSALALKYSIGRLRVFTSFSPLMRSFGFVFMHSQYHVGIQYTNDKQDNVLALRRQKNMYLYATYTI
jgi:hypothetical protein